MSKKVDEIIDFLVGLTPTVREGSTRCSCGTTVAASNPDSEYIPCTTATCPGCGRDVAVYFPIPDAKNPATQQLHLRQAYINLPVFRALVDSEASVAEMILALIQENLRLEEKTVELLGRGMATMYITHVDKVAYTAMSGADIPEEE